MVREIPTSFPMSTILKRNNWTFNLLSTKQVPWHTMQQKSLATTWNSLNKAIIFFKILSNFSWLDQKYTNIASECVVRILQCILSINYTFDKIYLRKKLEPIASKLVFKRLWKSTILYTNWLCYREFTLSYNNRY